MKLLGWQAIPDGVEARLSLNCFECSVHAWPERPVTAVCVEYPRMCFDCAETADLLEPTIDKVGHEGLSGRKGRGSRCTGRVAACNQCLCVCLYWHRADPFSTLEAVGPLVSNHRYPLLAGKHPAPLAPMQCLIHLSTGRVEPLHPVPPTEAPPAGSAPSWRCSS
jgi:hypothetical protein